jgi:hypothetical protein
MDAEVAIVFLTRDKTTWEEEGEERRRTIE